MPRPKLLTHWTGKDIVLKKPTALDDSERGRYLDRLLSVLEGGFWMTKPKERVTGWSKIAHGSMLDYQTPMTCFTELRLSAARAHALKYGSLGFVVDREWILARWGAPVFYVRSHPEEAIVGNMKQLTSWFEARKDAESQLLYNNLLVVVAFLKSMSNPETDDFAYIDENEWRIVFMEEQVAARRIVRTGVANPEFRIPIAPADLRLVIVPDSGVREMALADARVLKWLSGKHVPFVTTEEAMQF